MSVLLETSKGDLVVDLYTDDCPSASRNFLKLCKIKYYNNCMFHYVVRDFIAQTGDPTGTGTGGDSLNVILYGEQARFFDTEIRPHLRHKKKGLLSMAAGGKNLNASQFYITTAADLDSLDDKNTIFGEVTEGLEVLQAINEAFVDDKYRPLQNIRIRHTVVLDDPYPDPAQLNDHIPENSPPPVFADEAGRLEEDWEPTEDTRDPTIIEEESRRLEAEKRAEVLEMVGDLPTADAKPPPDMIFVCKLNPVTTEEDLEIIFSRFGKVTSCDIIRDFKTGDSLCYAFIGFDSDKAAEEAFFKMDNVLIDDRRIHVDFSQSMHHLWRQFKAFGKAGSAALGAEAQNMKPGGKLGKQHATPMELKTSAARGLYAGPTTSNRRDYELMHDDGEPAGHETQRDNRDNRSQSRRGHGEVDRSLGHRERDHKNHRRRSDHDSRRDRHSKDSSHDQKERRSHKESKSARDHDSRRDYKRHKH